MAVTDSLIKIKNINRL